MTPTRKAIETLRAIEIERELSAGEEARLIGLLRCEKEDDGQASEEDEYMHLKVRSRICGSSAGEKWTCMDDCAPLDPAESVGPFPQEPAQGSLEAESAATKALCWKQLRCWRCGKTASTCVPEATVVRGILECPECAASSSEECDRLRVSVVEKDAAIAVAIAKIVELCDKITALKIDLAAKRKRVSVPETRQTDTGHLWWVNAPAFRDERGYLCGPGSRWLRIARNGEALTLQQGKIDGETEASWPLWQDGERAIGTEVLTLASILAERTRRHEADARDLDECRRALEQETARAFKAEQEADALANALLLITTRRSGDSGLGLLVPSVQGVKAFEQASAALRYSRRRRFS